MSRLAYFVRETLISLRRNLLMTIAGIITVAISLFLFGGQVLHGFSLALVIGIVTGTFSSIFIASSILLVWEQWRAGTRAARVSLPTAEPTGGVR